MTLGTCALYVGWDNSLQMMMEEEEEDWNGTPPPSGQRSRVKNNNENDNADDNAQILFLGSTAAITAEHGSVGVGVARGVLQHGVFLAGTILSGIASVKDLYDAYRYTKDPNEDDDYDPDDIFEDWETVKVLQVISTSLYLADALRYIVMGEHHTSTGHEDYESTSLASSSSSLSSSSVASPSPPPPNPGQYQCQCQCQQCHRLWFAIVFGVAAFFDLACSLTESEGQPWPSYVCECISVQLYMACALLTLYGKRDVYCGRELPLILCLLRHTNANGNGNGDANLNINGGDREQEEQECARQKNWLLLLFCGDLFFFLGCTVDIIMSVVDNPLCHSSWVMASSGSLVSSTFWCVDALLYQWADADIFDAPLPPPPPPHSPPPGALAMVLLPQDQEGETVKDHRAAAAAAAAARVKDNDTTYDAS